MNATSFELTALDAALQLLVSAVYIAIAAAALAAAPRDERTRVFFAMASANVVGALVPTTGWFLGVKDALAYGRVPLGVMLGALSLGAMLLFHFSQIFPRRRPWIRSSGAQLPIAYVLAPVAVFLLVRWWPATPGDVTPKFGLMFLLFGFPLMVLLGLLLPVASIVSFLRTLRDFAATQGLPDPRPPVAGILLSQIGGGTLALLVVGPLAAVAPGSWALTFATITVASLGILTPLAYAAGVWKYRALEIPIDASAEVQTK